MNAVIEQDVCWDCESEIGVPLGADISPELAEQIRKNSEQQQVDKGE